MIKSRLKGSYDKQNLTLVVISYEILWNSSKARFINSYEMTTCVRSSIYDLQLYLSIYHAMGKFSRWQTDIFLIFARKWDLTYVRSHFLAKIRKLYIQNCIYKLSPKKTTCSKFQILFSRKNKRNISKCSAKFLLSMQWVSFSRSSKSCVFPFTLCILH